MTTINISKLKEETGIGFGTSGIRGLASSLTNQVCYYYTTAFIKYLERIGDIKDYVALAGDLRESTDRLMRIAAKAVNDCGYQVINCGKIPTPAVSLFAFDKKIPCIMVTGSHIPADRNGIKFTLSNREVLKEDEAAITSMLIDIEENKINEEFSLGEVNDEAKDLFVKRYTDFFDKDLFKGLRIGLYGHSAVSRDMLFEALTSLGAEVIKLAYSNEFVAVDTEVIEEELVIKGKEWSQKHTFDAIVSTDGDGDRPLVGDENGDWWRGDELGILVAKYLGMEALAMPVMCNSAVEKSGLFKKVTYTKVGSPYVVKGILDLEAEGYRTVGGYEGNGGFLIQTEIKKDNKNLKPLATRDAFIVILSVLALAKNERKTLSQLKQTLPQRFTQSSSIKGFPTDISLKIISRIDTKDEIDRELGETFGKAKEINITDGLRIIFENNEIVHFRPSMNSPEFRCYTEADSAQRANELTRQALEVINAWRIQESMTAE